MATMGLTHELRRVNWEAAEWRASLLCLPAIAIALVGSLALGHRSAALVMAGSAQSVGFGAFQRPLWFRGGPMVLATLGMALSAAVGELAANRPWELLVLVTFWAFCYGMSGAVSSPASWVGQQCCIFLVVSSAVGYPASGGIASGRRSNRRAASVSLRLAVVALLSAGPHDVLRSGDIHAGLAAAGGGVESYLPLRYISLRAAPSADRPGGAGHRAATALSKRLLDSDDSAHHHEAGPAAD